MSRLTKLKTRKIGDTTRFLVLINHPMETGFRRNKKTGARIPAHFIKEIVFRLNGKPVATGQLGIAVSANPILILSSKTAHSGDTLEVSWKDNKGESGSAQMTIA
ncbi:MAG: thiosulfate oxidation carrier complex protein SoxZ [Gammaproteobacteria bacterium]|nr:thiosulfate oxidation carrier complex protein SoxZ [Gammaproteobacteria bacterium]